MTHETNRRILLVDDNAAIHEDFKKILGAKRDGAKLADAKAAFFGASTAVDEGAASFEFDTATQGEEAIAKVRAARAAEKPFAMAFVDVRMPPGLDGIETIARIWAADPDVQAVVCTAFADYSWSDMVKKLGRSDRLLILKKPFDPIEVCQLALALTEKWSSVARERLRLGEARRAEAEARAYASSLATINRALETARAGAAAASKAKTEFLANMSHEIRTPMIAILGGAELIADPTLDEAARRENAAAIRASSHRLLAMIDDVLELAALEAGDRTTSPSEISPRALVEEIHGAHVDAASAKGLSFEMRVAADVPGVARVDRARLRQILNHLVGNAVKFTERGRVALSLACASAIGGGAPRLVFAVEDTGVGIERDLLARLFEPFSQADSSHTRKHGGAGLGLALARRLSQILGATLEIESEPGRGSRVRLELPLEGARVTEGEPLEIVDTRPRRDGAASAPLQGRILLVEDVMSTQRLVALHLRNAGADVECADDGRRALDMVAEACAAGRAYDLVLMDMQMPVLDGYAATRELRARGCTAPIVAVTAHALAGDRERCLAAGCNDYWKKPLEREDLVEGCREWIAKGVPPALPSTVAPSTSAATAAPGAPSAMPSGAPSLDSFLQSMRGRTTR